MRIGLLGMGTIGSGVYEIVAKRTDMEIARVLDLRRIPGLGGKLTTGFEDILEDPSIDTVVELMGGLEPAHEFVVRALRAGKNVVTANKLMLSHHYAEIAQAAARTAARRCAFRPASAGAFPSAQPSARPARWTTSSGWAALSTAPPT